MYAARRYIKEVIDAPYTTCNGCFFLQLFPRFADMIRKRLLYYALPITSGGTMKYYFSTLVPHKDLSFIFTI